MKTPIHPDMESVYADLRYMAAYIDILQDYLLIGRKLDCLVVSNIKEAHNQIIHAWVASPQCHKSISGKDNTPKIQL
jgi:hypothetical protein